MHRLGAAFVLCCHPFLSGRPSRAEALERLIERMKSLDGLWITTVGEAARHTASLNLAPRSCPRPVIPADAYWVARPPNWSRRYDARGKAMAETSITEDPLERRPVRDFKFRSAFSLSFADLSPIVGIYTVFAIGLIAAGPAFPVGLPARPDRAAVRVWRLREPGLEMAVPGQRLRLVAGTDRPPVRVVHRLGLHVGAHPHPRGPADHSFPLHPGRRRCDRTVPAHRRAGGHRSRRSAGWPTCSGGGC